MMSQFDELKRTLGADYGFHQELTVDEIKKILEAGEVDDGKLVPLVLEAGNLDIEMVINPGEYLNDSQVTPMSLEYFCCVRIDGEWESYNDILDEVNLDVPDIEAEMLRVLDKYAKEEGLSFTDHNKSYIEKYFRGMEMR